MLHQEFVPGNTWVTEWQPPEAATNLHGGSNLVEHNGQLWRVVHDRIEPFRDKRLYRLWLMSCDPQPPFAPRSISQRPFLVARPEEDMANAVVAHSVLFCQALERVEGGWQIWMGVNDRRMARAFLPDGFAV